MDLEKERDGLGYLAVGGALLYIAIGNQGITGELGGGIVESTALLLIQNLVALCVWRYMRSFVRNLE